MIPSKTYCVVAVCLSGFVLAQQAQQTPRVLQVDTAVVSSVAWSPDGKVLASASHDNMIWLFERETELVLRFLRGHDASVISGVSCQL
jgi:WD40 repeat protein